jgi:hypothetical protein
MLFQTIVSDFENNLILYFFSAMPQVLGTMLALLGAFYPSRSGNLRNEVRELNNVIQKKVYEFNKIGGLPYYSKKEVNSLTHQLLGDDRSIALSVYYMEDQELIFQNDFDTIEKLVFSEYSLVDINTLYRSFVFHYHQALATFFTRKERLIDKNSDLMSKYPSLVVRSYFILYEIGEIVSLMKSAQNNIDLYNKMRQSIKDLFVFNGMVLIFFILSFLLLKYTSDSILIHKSFLYLGASFAAISAYSMIYYVYNSVSEKAQTSLFGFNIRINLKRVILWIKGKWRKK